jgi:hypothetical protein
MLKKRYVFRHFAKSKKLIFWPIVINLCLKSMEIPKKPLYYTLYCIENILGKANRCRGRTEDREIGQRRDKYTKASLM